MTLILIVRFESDEAVVAVVVVVVEVVVVVVVVLISSRRCPKMSKSTLRLSIPELNISAMSKRDLNTKHVP